MSSSKKNKGKTKPSFDNTSHLAINIADNLTHNPACAALGITSEDERKRLVKNIMLATLATLGKLVMVKVPLNVLYVDLTYQRFRSKDILNLVGQYDVDKAKAIELNYREDEERLYIIDGLHRVIAAILSGEEYILAFVYIGKTQTEEAELFRYQNKNRIPLKPGDDYKAGLTANHRDCLELQKLAKKYNLSIDGQKAGTAGQLRNIKTILEIIDSNENGIELLTWTFDLMKAASWFDDSLSTTSQFIKNFACIYNNAITDDNLDVVTERFSNVMSVVSATSLTAYAKLKYASRDKRGFTMALMNNIANGKVTVNDIRNGMTV